MSKVVRHYPDWKAPSEDGDILLWPAPKDLLRQTLENHRQLAGEDSVHLQGVPLNELRQRQRRWLGQPDDRAMIATGHQTELYHPGVWAKHAAIHAAVEKLNASGEAEASGHHFAVDTDSPKHLNLRWPGGSMPISDDPNLTSAEWSGLLQGPTPMHLKAVSTALDVAESGWKFDSCAGGFLDSLRRLAMEDAGLSLAITNAMHELDWSLGLRHHAVICSPIWQSEPYLLFVHYLLARAGEFAADYNAALAEYRIANKIRGKTRPMPDLKLAGDVCEAPFWLDHLATGRRWRAQVERAGEGSWILRSQGGAAFELSPALEGWQAAQSLLQFLRENNLRLAPRALTLTLFLRLAVVDQFVHGIGGGRYDQVCDALIGRHFGIAAPHFAVATATLIFPDAVGRPRTCLPCIVQDGHRLRHRVLEEKPAIVAAIEILPRKSHQRQRAFSDMHAMLSAAAANHPSVKSWERQYRQAREDHLLENALFDRELFYGIQPAGRLQGLIQKYAAVFG